MTQRVAQRGGDRHHTLGLGARKSTLAGSVTLRVSGLALAIALLVLLLSAAVVQAQTPADDQYGGRIAPGEGKTGGEVKSRPAGLKAGVLPATGGPLFLGYAVVVLASSAGLVILHRRSGRGS